MKATFWRRIHGGGKYYLTGLAAASLLMIGAGRPGSEMAPAAENRSVDGFPASNRPAAVRDETVLIAAGQKLFLKNCAHCHGPDAHGDEGPDLHDLDWTDEQIAARILKGKKGQMTAFAGKLSADDIRAVIAYLRTLK